MQTKFVPIRGQPGSEGPWFFLQDVPVKLYELEKHQLNFTDDEDNQGLNNSRIRVPSKPFGLPSNKQRPLTTLQNFDPF
jgi:hypothetical protein